MKSKIIIYFCESFEIFGPLCATFWLMCSFYLTSSELMLSFIPDKSSSVRPENINVTAVQLNFRAGLTFPVQVCTVPSFIDRTSWCNKVNAVEFTFNRGSEVRGPRPELDKILQAFEIKEEKYLLMHKKPSPLP